jgi:hypothetical protein
MSADEFRGRAIRPTCLKRRLNITGCQSIQDDYSRALDSSYPELRVVRLYEPGRGRRVERLVLHLVLDKGGVATHVRGGLGGNRFELC